jgi:hypothetical protein
MERKIKTKPFLEQKNPAAAAVALTVLAETGSAREAGRVSRMSDHTVLAIAERLPEDFAQIKKLRGFHHFNLAEKCMTELDGRDLSEVNPVNLSIMSGIHTQRGLDCIANDVPMPFDPQLTRRAIEDSDFCRNELQRRGLKSPVLEGTATDGEQGQGTRAEGSSDG